MSLSDYHATAGNWRLQLQRNERYTRWVIVTFIAIYVAVGLLVDTIALEELHSPQLSLEESWLSLLTLQAIPFATILMLGFALFSILITYALHNKIMLLGTKSREITPETAQSLEEKQLYHVVEEMKVAAGLKFMPKVYLIDADYMNAFASGYSEKSAMVAITRGLFEKLDRAELQAVMAHELSHIRHHDIKLALMVAVLSNILLIIIDVLFYSIVFKRNNRRDDNRLVLIITLLRYILPLITVILTLFLSRAREYMADSGAVELMRDNEPMARALLKISQDHQQNAAQYTKEYGNTAHEQIRQISYLFDPSSIDPVKSFNNVFATHPPVDERLRALGFKRKKTKKGD